MSAPSIVPSETFYIVRDQAADGDVLCEMDVRHSHFDDVLNDMVAARYRQPVAVYAFNPEEGWSRDVSEEIARELQSLIDVAQGELQGNSTSRSMSSCGVMPGTGGSCAFACEQSQNNSSGRFHLDAGFRIGARQATRGESSCPRICRLRSAAQTHRS